MVAIPSRDRAKMQALDTRSAFTACSSPSMTAEWKTGVEAQGLITLSPHGLLVVEKIRFTPPAHVERLQLVHRVLAAGPRAGFSDAPVILDKPIAELSIGKEFFVTPGECVSIYFHGNYTGEVEFVCHEPVLSPALGEAAMPL